MRDEQELLTRRKHAMLNQLASVSALAVETAENMPDVPRSMTRHSPRPMPAQGAAALRPSWRAIPPSAIPRTRPTIKSSKARLEKEAAQSRLADEKAQLRTSINPIRTPMAPTTTHGGEGPDNQTPSDKAGIRSGVQAEAAWATTWQPRTAGRQHYPVPAKGQSQSSRS